MFRNLDASEIEVRVSRVFGNQQGTEGVELLLYKDARCDARILDETVGPENWECEFYECKGTLFCKVGINIERGEYQLDEWVYKSDAGAPSNMESVKGEASDAFKRACFKWGIGRELYTAPRVSVYSNKGANCVIRDGRNGRRQCYDKFEVSKVAVEEGRITGLRIVNASLGGKIVFSWKEEGGNDS